METLARLSIAAALSAAPFAAHAVEPLDTFSLRAGGYVTSFDTKVRADGETQSGTRIDLQRDLGVDDDNVLAFVGLTWRPFERHEFGVSYYRDDNEGERRLERRIEFDGTVYDVAATVRASVDMDAYEAYYVWWAASRDTWALGPRLGLVWYAMDLRLSLEADADGNPVGEGSASSEVSGDVPAPSIGGSFRWTPHEDWRLSAEVGYFSANINDIDADVLYGRLGAEWFPWQRAGFSLDYTISEIDADVTRSRFDGNVDFVDSGLRLGLVYRF